MTRATGTCCLFDHIDDAESPGKRTEALIDVLSAACHRAEQGMVDKHDQISALLALAESLAYQSGYDGDGWQTWLTRMAQSAPESYQAYVMDLPVEGGVH